MFSRCLLLVCLAGGCTSSTAPVQVADGTADGAVEVDVVDVVAIDVVAADAGADPDGPAESAVDAAVAAEVMPPGEREAPETGIASFEAGTTCDYPRACAPLDLGSGDHLVAGGFSRDAQCHLDAMRMGRPGLLEIRDGDRLWMVFNQVQGPVPIVYFDEALDKGRANARCTLDAGFVERCRAANPSCLLPDNWAVMCETEAFECPTPPRSSGACRPTAGPPYWIEEGETLHVSLTVVCEDGRGVPTSEVQFPSLPEGASYEPETGQFRWTPGLDQAATYDLLFRLRATDEPGELRVGVADAFDDPANEPIRDPSQYLFEYGLPVFFLEDPEQEEYTLSSLTYAGRRYGRIEIKVRGRNSLAYPKHSYTLKFPYEDLFQEPGREGGLVDRKKLVLTTSFDDNSYVRQHLAHVMWGMLDPEHISVRSYPAVVYRDNEFRGLYTVSDHIDRHMMRNNGYSDQGELFKSSEHAGDFLEKNHLMEKKEGLPLQGEPGWDESLQEVIRRVVLSTDEEFFSEVDDYLDVRDYQNWWVFMIATGASDTTGKNVYHYKEGPDSPFRLIPWDFNETFGQNWRTVRSEQRISRLRRNGIWMRMVAYPQARAEIRDRLLSALHGPYDLDGILALVSTYYRQVEPVALRDWRRWEAEYTAFERWSDRQDFTTPEEEIAYIRSWLTDRWVFLESDVDRLLTPIDINEEIPHDQWETADP